MKIKKEKLNVQEEFVITAIKALKDPKYKGVHSVYSGFNAAFREEFPKADPVVVTNRMKEEGKIETSFARGGVMLYLPGMAPERADKGKDALAKIKKAMKK